jgi:hypothetical protein
VVVNAVSPMKRRPLRLHGHRYRRIDPDGAASKANDQTFGTGRRKEAAPQEPDGALGAHPAEFGTEQAAQPLLKPVAQTMVGDGVMRRRPKSAWSSDVTVHR